MKKRGLKEKLDEGPVICAEGFLFEIERRGYMSSHFLFGTHERIAKHLKNYKDKA